MTSDEENLINTTEYKGNRVVVITNDSRTQKTYIDKTVFVPHHNSRQVKPQNVSHVLGMKKNLLSVSLLITLENYVVFKPDDVKVYQSFKATSSAIMKERRLKLINVMPTKITYVVLEETPRWWYEESHYQTQEN